MNYKNVVVIGNGCGVLQKERGHIIDNFDCVVRLGSCKTKGFEKYVGTKTDIYCTHIDKFFNIDKHTTTLKDIVFRTYPIDFIPENILFMENEPDAYVEVISQGDNWGAEHIPNPIAAAGEILLERLFKRSKFSMRLINTPRFNNRIVYDFFIEHLINSIPIKNILFYSKYERAKMMASFNCDTVDKKISYPSNGMFALDYVFNNIMKENVYVIGFDGFVTRHYCNPVYETFFKAHNSFKEKIIYKKLLKEGKIHEL